MRSFLITIGILLALLSITSSFAQPGLLTPPGPPPPTVTYTLKQLIEIEKELAPLIRSNEVKGGAPIVVRGAFAAPWVAAGGVVVSACVVWMMMNRIPKEKCPYKGATDAEKKEWVEAIRMSRPRVGYAESSKEFVDDDQIAERLSNFWNSQPITSLQPRTVSNGLLVPFLSGRPMKGYTRTITRIPVRITRRTDDEVTLDRVRQPHERESLDLDSPRRAWFKALDQPITLQTSRTLGDYKVGRIYVLEVPVQMPKDPRALLLGTLEPIVENKAIITLDPDVTVALSRLGVTDFHPDDQVIIQEANQSGRASELFELAESLRTKIVSPILGRPYEMTPAQYAEDFVQFLNENEIPDEVASEYLKLAMSKGKEQELKENEENVPRYRRGDLTADEQKLVNQARRFIARPGFLSIFSNFSRTDQGNVMRFAEEATNGNNGNGDPGLAKIILGWLSRRDRVPSPDAIIEYAKIWSNLRP